MDSHIIFRVLLIIVAAFVLVMLINYYNTKQKDGTVQKERFFNPSDNNSVRWDTSSNGIVGSPVSMDYQQGPVKPSEESYKDDNYRPVDFETQKLPSDCFPRDRLTSADLLPASANSKFAQINPSGQGDVGNQNFLSAGYHLGIDSIGSTHKNPNLQLRSDPVIQKGSWPIMNSSIEPDLLHRRFELD